MSARFLRALLTATCLAATPVALAQPVPSVSLSVPGGVMIGDSFAVTATFENIGTADGFGPFIDLLLPTNGVDGATVGPPQDGVSFVSASYLGAPATTSLLSFPDDGGGSGCVDHPYLVDSGHVPYQVCGPAGDTLLVILLPFGSFVPSQPPAPVTVNLQLSDLADLGTPLDLRARAGFQFGADPLDNPCCDPVLATPIDADPATWPAVGPVVPSLLTLTKSYVGPEDETATGPNFPRQYTVAVEIAPGQTLTDLDLTDVLPPTVQFLAVDATSGPTSAIATPSTSTPGGTLTRRFASVTGTASMTFSFYVPRLDAASAPVNDPTSGDDASAPDEASAAGGWTPVDPRDPVTPATAGGPGPEHTLTPKSIAIQKSVAVIVGGPQPTPGDLLEYTLELQVSDFFAFSGLQLTDVFSDGQRLEGNPQLAVSRHGTSSPMADLDAASWTAVVDSPGTGSTTLAIDVSAELVARGFDAAGELLGGCVPGGGTGGPPPDCSVFNGGGTTVTVTFQTRIQDEFTDTFPSGDPSVDHGDPLGNTVVVDADVLAVADLSAAGTTEVDGSGAGVTIARGALAKTVYAINGSTTLPVPLEIFPGDTVTYRLRYTLPSSDFEDLALTDYLPLPIFAAAEVTVFDGSSPGTVPAAGAAGYGPVDTLSLVPGAPTPALSVDPPANSVVFTYGDFDDPGNAPSELDLLFTVTVSDEPFADALFLTNQARAEEGSTTLDAATDDDIVQIVVREPYLQVTKGACAAGNPGAVFDPAGPVCPGSPFTSSDLAGANVDADLAGVDLGDLMTFTIVIENTGGSGAFDLGIRDVMPPGFGIPSGGLGLAIVRGDGLVVSLEPGYVETDLFALGGLRVADDGLQPLCQPYSPAAGTNVLVVTYQLQVTDPAVVPASLVANSGGLTSFSGTEGGPNHVDDPSDWDDSTDITLDSPEIAKGLLPGSSSEPSTTFPAVAVGETFQYQVVVRVPEGSSPLATLTDVVDAGLVLVSVDGIVPSSGDLSTDVAGGFAGVLAGAVLTPTTLTLSLGTVTNVNTDNGVAETLTVVYTVRVDAASAAAGQQLDNLATWSWSLGSVSDSGELVTVVEPVLAVTKGVSATVGNGALSGSAGPPENRNLGGADAGDLVTFQVTVAHTGTSTADAFDLEITDVLPVGLTFAGNVIPVSGPAPAVDASALPTVRFSWAGLDRTTGGLVFRFDVTIDPAVSPNTLLTNTASLVWDCLPGETDERDYGPLSDPATVGVANVVLTKTAPATSELHTTGANLAVGEIVRYRLVVELPEGTSENLQLLDQLPPGMRFVDDGTATLAMVSNGSPLASSNPVGDTLGLGLGAGPFGTAPWVNGNDPTAVTPTFVLPDVNVGSTSSLTADPDSFASGTDVSIKLGTVVNADSDLDREYLVVELNAVVLNIAATVENFLLRNNFRVYVATVNLRQSGNVDSRVREPAITNLAKLASPTSGDAGDTIAYTLSYSNTGTTTAFEVQLVDVLPALLTPSFPPVVTLGGGAVGVTDASAGGTLDVTVAQVPVGGTVQVTFTATIVTAVPPNASILNTSSLEYTSLPGTGTVGNPTGSTTPGASGADDGERDGSNGTTAPDDYTDTAQATVTVASPTLSKVIVATSQPTTGSEAGSDLNDPGVEDLAIGETVTYRLTATLPEGLTPAVTITDTLPIAPGILGVVSTQVVSVGGDLFTDSGMGAPASGTVTVTDNRPAGGDGVDDHVLFDFGQVFNNPDGDADDGDRIVVEVVARVENLAANVDGLDLANSALLNFGLGLVNATDVTVEVVEPRLAVDKSNPSPNDAGDAGDAITFTVTVQHTVGSTADAFDVVVSDVVPAGMTWAGNVQSLSGPAPVVDASGAPTIAFSWEALTIGSVSSFTFDVTLDADVQPGQAIVNTAVLAWDSLPDDGVPFDRDGGDSDDAGVLITEPGLAKAVANVALDTSVAATGTAVNGPEADLTIGETVVYTITVTVPEGVQLGAVLVDQLPVVPFGVLEYLSATVTPGGNLILDSDPGTPGDQPPVITPSDGPDADALLDLVTIDLGVVTNAADGVANADDEIVVRVSATVVDVPFNQGGLDDLPNLASYTWTGAAAPLEAHAEVDLVAPALEVVKTNPTPYADAGDILTYRLEVNHTAASTADAFDVLLDDTLPPGQVFVGLLAVGGDPLPAVDASTPGHVVFSYSSVPLAAGGYAFDLQVQLDTSVEAGESYLNLVDLLWDTLPGAGDPDDRPGADSDTAEVTVNAPGIVKVTSATSLGDTGTAQHDAVLEDLAIGELVTYTLTVTFPEGTTSSVLITDQVQSDAAGVLEIYDLRILSTGADIAASQAILSPPAPIPAGTTVATFDLGTVTNSPSDGGAITDNDRMVLEVVARVVNDPANADADNLANLATLTFLNGSDDDDAFVDVVEPATTLDKTLSGPVDGIVTIILALGNVGTAPAYDIAVADLLPAATWDTTTVSPVAVPPGFVLATSGAPGDATVTISSDPGQTPPSSSVEPGEVVTFVVSAALADPLPPSPIANTATNTVATTLPGPSPDERDEPDVADTDQLALPEIEVDKAAALAPGGDLDGSGTPSPGDVLRYTVTITNSGTAPATALSLTDPVSDPNLSLVVGVVTATAGGVVVLGNGPGDTTVQVDLATLPAATSAVVTFDVAVANPVAAGVSQLVNWASVSSDQLPDEPSDDPSTPADDDPTVVTLDAAPDLAVVKDDGVVATTPGATLVYTLTVSNLGNQNATGVVVTDTLPANTTFVAASDGGAETPPGSGVVGWPVFALAAGTNVQRTVTVTVDDPVPAGVTSLLNTVVVVDDGANGPDPDPSNNADDDTDTLDAVPDLSLTKDDGVSVVAPGDTLTYTLTIANLGDQGATGVLVSDALPPHTAFVAASDGGAETPPGSGVVVWPLFDLAAGATVLRTVTLTVDDPVPAGVDTLTNQATVADDGANGPDPDPTTNSDDDTDTLGALPDLAVVKDDGVTVVSPGDTLTYTLTVSNLGNQNASGVLVTDTLPADTTFVAGSDGGAETPPGSGVIAWPTFDLAAGGVVTRTVTVTVDSPFPLGVTELVNLAEVTDDGANGADPDPTNDSDDDTDTVTVHPSLAADKADALLVDGDGDGEVDPGDTLRYTVIVANDGDVEVVGVRFVDAPDPNTALTVGSVTTSQGVVVLGNGAGDTTVDVDLGNLLAGATATVTFDVVVDPSLPSTVTLIVNQGVASGDEVPGVVTDDPDTPQVDDPTLTPVGGGPLLDVTKRDELLVDADLSGGPSAGDTLLYTVTLLNLGAGDASNVVLTDTPDANTTLVVGSVTTTQGSVTAGNTAGDTAVAVDLGALVAGGSAVVAFQTVIADPLPPGVTLVSNQGLVTSDDNPAGEPTDDPDTPADDDPTDTSVGGDPDLEVRKTDTLAVDVDGDGAVSPGDVLRYVITVASIGGVDLTGVVLSDSPGPLTTLVAGSVVASQGAVITGNGGGDTTVVVDLGVVSAGATATVVFDVAIAAPLPAGTTILTNQAVVTSDQLPDEPSDDPDTGADGDPTDTPVSGGGPDLQVVKDDGQSLVAPPADVTYTITVTNVGSRGASGVVLTDTLPVGTGFVAASDGGAETAPGSGLVEWPPVTLEVGDSIVRTVTVHVPEQPAGGPGEITNVVWVADDGANGDDPNPGDNTDDDTDTLGLLPVIRVEKVASAPPLGMAFQPGDTITWWVTVSNLGNVGATGLPLADEIPSGTDYVLESMVLDSVALTDAVDGDAGAYDAGGDRVTVVIASLPAGASTTLRFATVIQYGSSGHWTISNQAVVTTSDGDVTSDDPDTPDLDDPTDVTVEIPGIPASGPLGGLLLIMLLATAGVMLVRRR